MGTYINTDDYWEIDFNDNFEEQLKRALANAQSLERVQIYGYNLKKSQEKQLKEYIRQVYNELILKYKAIELRFYAFENKPFDMDWIADLSEIENLQIESWGEILHIEKLANFPNLQKLHLDFGLKMKGDLEFLKLVNPHLQTLYIRAAEKKAKVDLMPITHFKSLKGLWVMYFEKNLDNVLTELTELQWLRLRSISGYKDLAFIGHLQDLSYLGVEFCGFEDLSAVASLKNLTAINLFRLLKVDTLDFMSELHKLTNITID
ncbi:MAG: hypothetical protein Q4C98_09670, partial [Capnocytophaga sp.]|nr:hypothetical protein [Capnocytophaga sp.]